MKQVKAYKPRRRFCFGLLGSHIGYEAALNAAKTAAQQARHEADRDRIVITNNKIVFLLTAGLQGPDSQQRMLACRLVPEIVGGQKVTVDHAKTILHRCYQSFDNNVQQAGIEATHLLMDTLSAYDPELEKSNKPQVRKGSDAYAHIVMFDIMGDIYKSNANGARQMQNRMIIRDGIIYADPR